MCGFVGGLASQAALGFGFDEQTFETDRLLAVDALAVVASLQAGLRFGHGCQGLQVDVGQRLIDLAVAGTLWSVIAVLQQQLAGELDARLVMLVHGHLLLQRQSAGLQGLGERGPLIIGDRTVHAIFQRV